jgi:ribonuclease R
MTKDAGRFKSFKDLKRQETGEPAKRVEPEVRLEGSLEARAKEAAASAESGAASTRERIDRRPNGFGPMEHGPAPYRDEGSEEMQILASFRVRTAFPKDVKSEVAKLPRDPDPKEYAGRADLRKKIVYTIDGEDAKDFDDAISIEDLGGGDVEVGVHIADVAHYVRPGTALDDEALARATSVYVADQVVPMLPEELSNHLCSLVGERDRFAYSVFMVFDQKGARKSARVTKSVIRSVRRNTYREVQEFLDGVDNPATRQIKERGMGPSLLAFQKWTVRQQQIRDAKGSMRMASVEKKFVFDKDHEPIQVVDAPRYFSMSLIEETALAANQAVGDLFKDKGLPAIYRVHPEKDPEEIEAVAASLEEHGIRVPKKDRLTGRDIARLIAQARKKPNAEALIQRIMGLIERAVYEVHDHEDVAGHFGLARKAYLHFTSPIRRYPDLIVHRWLWAVESRPDDAARELRALDIVEDLNATAYHCSLQSELAEMTEQSMFDLKVCQFMYPRIGEKLRAQVVRVSPPGLEVKLLDLNISGFLPSRAIGERVEIKGPTMTIKAGRKSLSFTEGHPISVRVKDVDFVRLQVMLELA